MITKTPSLASKTRDSLGWYKRFFAWLMAHANANYEKDIADWKRALFADIDGNVLEIGSGISSNLSYYILTLTHYA